MSYYDDASIMFIGGAATGVDGKAGTAKPIDGGSPLFVTRGSNLTATRVDSNGLIEKGRENLLKDSNSFDPSGTAWNPTTAFTLTSGQEGYDGTNDAWLLNKPDTLNDYFQQRSINGMSGNVITESIYAKAGTEVGLMLYNPNGYAHWNLSSGTLISEGANPISSNIESIGNGWYRCSVTVDADVSYDRMMIKVVNSNAANSSGSIYIQDAQIEIGLAATEYIESGASTGKAGLLENEPRFNYPIGGSVAHLLLEPQRTNSILYSEALLSYNTFKVIGSEVTLSYTTNTTPEGLNSGVTTVLEGEATSNHRCYFEDIEPCTIGSSYSFSVFAKSVKGRNIRIGDGGKGFEVDTIVDLSDGSILTDANNNVSVEDYGNGWYKISAFGTNNSIHSSQRLFINSVDGTTLSFAGDTTKGFLLWGAQYEEGSYPTSYIPNHSGGSVTRESEVVQTASVSSLINQDEGTLFLDYEFLDGQTAESQNWIALESENGHERVLIYKAASGNSIRVYMSANNSLVFQANDLITISPNTRYKVAFRYNTGSQAVYINGSLVHSSTHTYTRGSDLSRLRFNESNIQPNCRVHETIAFQSGWDNVDLEILTGATPYQSFESMAAALNYTVYE